MEEAHEQIQQFGEEVVQPIHKKYPAPDHPGDPGGLPLVGGMGAAMELRIAAPIPSCLLPRYARILKPGTSRSL